MVIKERIKLNKKEVEEIENDILVKRHIERYAIIRQFVYGNVIDCACGVGYGTHILAKNQDVQKIYGIDIDNDSILHAKKEFETEKIKFINRDIKDFKVDNIDMMVSLETIEHLKNPKDLYHFANNNKITELIISFPSKKTTHYNPYHFWDLTTQDIMKIFAPEYVIINKFSYTFDTIFIHFVRNHRKMSLPKRYNK